MKRPLSVRLFEKLLCLGYAATAATALYRPEPPRPGLLIGVAVGIGILLFLVWLAAWRRENWARVLLFVMFMLGTISIIPDIPRYLNDPVAGLFQLAITSVEGLAYWFAFTGDSRAWFDKNRPDISAF